MGLIRERVGPIRERIGLKRERVGPIRERLRLIRERLEFIRERVVQYDLIDAISSISMFVFEFFHVIFPAQKLFMGVVLERNVSYDWFFGSKAKMHIFLFFRTQL